MTVEPQEEKREAFKAILLNDAMSPSPNAEKDLFVKITEDLTHEHIKALKILADPQTAYQHHSKIRESIQGLTGANQFEPIVSDMRSCLLQPALPEIPIDHWPVILDALSRYGLIPEPEPTWGAQPVFKMTADLKPRTTLLGNRYLKFITLE